ncbi:cbb3-type cytochrome oxidase assembly protein CcoS [Pseudothauera lacus]|uniref:Cbb3-type cytochrome oxidase assembly protein CcoS n=1 Tax=Pseudothauera lacus TaxID=2136175 RepID=A0A2T4IHM5_9RHOO|nr:cbb3-type cytochrome oxidase assembly protein CcoS [Pseudothauera lacus]PTD97226.1 cbb3-type cytochrome oxidase assembly protein CcoS [Pseudothauera lacus]
MDGLLGSLYILIPLSVVLVFLIGMIFWWSVRSGQFDDLEGPAYRLMMDDRDQPPDADENKGDGTGGKGGER